MTDAKTAIDAVDGRSAIPQLRYAAFISYSHKDASIARWLHSALESFPVPEDLRVSSGRTRLAPVFRDEADLAGAASLSEAITRALEESSALIVIGSPASANSKWVDQEIVAFRRTGRGDHILCLIADGEPFASERGDPEHECFPRALRYAFDPATGAATARAEPLGVDLRKDGKTDALLRIAAGLLGVGFDQLKRRDLRRRQHQLIVLSAVSVAGMAITSGLALTAWRAEQDARAQHAVAEREANIARETTSFLLSLFQNADPFRTRGEKITAREVLDSGLTRIRTAFPKAPEIRASLIGSMGEVYQGLGLYKTSQQLFGELETSQLGAVLDPVRRLRFLNSYAETSYNSGDYAKAKALMYAAEPLLRLDATASDPVERGRTRNIMGQLALQDGDATAAESLLERNLEELSKSDHDTRLQRALSHFTLGVLKLERHDDPGARNSLETALALRRDALGDDHPWVAEVENALAISDYGSGRYVEAETRWNAILPSYAKYFGDEHPEYSSLLQNYALTVLERGNFAEAEKLFLHSIAIDRKDKAPDHDDFAYSLNSLALAELGLGRRREAKMHLDEGIAIARKHHHRMRAPLLMNRADIACREHDTGAAKAWLDEARVALGEDYPDEPWRAAQLDNVALFCVALTPGAKPDLARLVATLPEIEKHWGNDRLYAREARWRIRRAFAAQGKPPPELRS
jgi:tetratricopeptide (TPR) repeat protein